MLVVVSMRNNTLVRLIAEDEETTFDMMRVILVYG